MSELLGEFHQRRVESGAPADVVDGLEAADRDEPCSRIGWHAIPCPLFDCDGKRIVQCLLGNLKIAQQADQRREHLARFSSVDRLYYLAYVFDFIFAHQH